VIGEQEKVVRFEKAKAGRYESEWIGYMGWVIFVGVGGFDQLKRRIYWLEQDKGIGVGEMRVWVGDG
jgi:hypothetical protein